MKDFLGFFLPKASEIWRCGRLAGSRICWHIWVTLEGVGGGGLGSSVYEH